MKNPNLNAGIITQKAQVNEDAGICDQMRNIAVRPIGGNVPVTQRDKDNCKSEVYKKTDDIEKCKKLEYNKGCLTYFARENEDLSICESVNFGDDKLEEIAKCKAGAATEVSYCASLMDEQLQTECYISVAEYLEDYTVCDNILSPEENSREFCYVEVFHKTRDFDCSLIKGSYSKHECLNAEEDPSYIPFMINL